MPGQGGASDGVTVGLGFFLRVALDQCAEIANGDLEGEVERSQHLREEDVPSRCTGYQPPSTSSLPGLSARVIRRGAEDSAHHL